MYYIGIDLGTSAVKLLLMQGDGQIANIVSREYPIAFPHPGWSEQNPADWWDAVCAGIPELLNGFDASQVAGIGAGGQMHGLVMLDKDGNVVDLKEDEDALDTFNLSRMDADDDRHRNVAEDAEFEASGFEFEDAPEDAGADVDVDFDDE